MTDMDPEAREQLKRDLAAMLRDLFARLDHPLPPDDSKRVAYNASMLIMRGYRQGYADAALAVQKEHPGIAVDPVINEYSPMPNWGVTEGGR